MTGKRPIARFFAAAILLIVFALAPSLAEAHAGHNHGTIAASPSQATPMAADEVAAVEQSTKAAPAEWRTVSSNAHSGSQEAPCTMGCCSGFSCTACSALVIPESLNVGLFTPSHIFETPEILARTGVIPGGLRRPPRSFA